MIDKVIGLMDLGKPFCLATVVTSTNPDVRPGRKAIVLEDGSMEGGTGSAQADATLRGLALETLGGNERRTVELHAGVRVFLDVLSGEAKLLVCGAGHIALSLARFARETGFHVPVLDDRSAYAHPSRFPGCDVIAENFPGALRDMSLGLSTYVVVITRGHEHDVECLVEVLRKECAYVGLIGSRRRVRFVLDILDRKGVPKERLAEVFTPIGLSIGSESPEEIALSIAAELVCVRRAGAGRALALRAAAGDGK